MVQPFQKQAAELEGRFNRFTTMLRNQWTEEPLNTELRRTVMSDYVIASLRRAVLALSNRTGQAKLRDAPSPLQPKTVNTSKKPLHVCFPAATFGL